VVRIVQARSFIFVEYYALFILFLNQ